MKEESKAATAECGPASARQRGAPSGCQLPTAGTGATPLGAREQLRIWSVRLLRAAERRISRLATHLSRPGATSSARESGRPTADSPPEADGPFERGDVVEVLDYAAITATLDERRRCDGLEFMDGMARFCGQRRRVLNKVRLFYDEHDRRMLKMKRDRYLLEGVICDGYGAFGQEGCDRACFYFWSSRWLKRADLDGSSVVS